MEAVITVAAEVFTAEVDSTAADSTAALASSHTALLTVGRMATATSIVEASTVVSVVTKHCT